MPPRLVGDTIPERKRRLAELVRDHINASVPDEHATLVDNQPNLVGHRDLVRVHSTPNLGVIHVTAIGNTPQDNPLPFFQEEGGQDWLEGKSFVAFGWVDAADRTLIFFVDAEFVKNNPTLSKRMIRDNRDRRLSVVLPPD